MGPAGAGFPALRAGGVPLQHRHVRRTAARPRRGRLAQSPEHEVRGGHRRGPGQDDGQDGPRRAPGRGRGRRRGAGDLGDRARTGGARHRAGGWTRGRRGHRFGAGRSRRRTLTVPMAKILVADPLAEDGLERLRQAGEVTVVSKLAEAELIRRIPEFDALVVRSETRVPAPLIQAGPELRRVHGLEMDVIAYDPVVAVERAELFNVALVSLHELLERADFVTLHVPLVDSNRNLLGAAELALMKPTARLINTARGGIVDETALCAAMQSGRLAAAAAGAFEQEPRRATPLRCLTM